MLPGRFLLLIFLCFGPAFCQTPDLARMDQIAESYFAGKQFMGSVLIARGGDVLLNKGYGSADIEWNVPNSPGTKFRLGSITKQFTAACVLLLEERGKWKVEEPIKKYMPDAPAAWDKITLFHLLTHTSGIPNFTSFSEYRDIEPFTKTPEQLVSLFRNKPLDFEPGAKWSYSNSGYVLLGYLLEKVSGEPYAKFVQENIFNPLGMKDSGYDSNTAVILHRASGYTPGKDGLQNAGYINMSIPFSAGALYSTTGDLLRWEQGLFGGKVLSATSLKKMTTPFKSDYAFGLTVRDVKAGRVIEHGGGIEGFNTLLAYYPDDKVTVVVLSNVNGNAPADMAAKLGAVAHGEKVELTSERKEITLSRDILSRYVGSYEFAPGMNMAVTLDGDQLHAKLGAQPAVAIYPASETSFFLKVVDAQIDFEADDKGNTTGLILHQNGQDHRAPRITVP